MPLMSTWEVDDGAPQRARLYSQGDRIFIKIGGGKAVPKVLHGDRLKEAAALLGVEESLLPAAWRSHLAREQIFPGAPIH